MVETRTPVKKIAMQSGVLFAARIAGAAVAFASQVLIARLWGADLLGGYLYVIAAVNLIGTLMPAGFQTVASYFAAEYSTAGNGQLLSRFIAAAYRNIASIAMVAIAGGAASSLFLATSSLFQEVWLPAVLLAVVGAISYVNGGALVGLRAPFIGYSVDTLAKPLVAAVAILAAALVSQPPKIATVLWIFLLLFAVCCFVHAAALRHKVLALPAGHIATQDRARWWRFALPWAITALATDLFLDVNMMILGTLLPKTDLAVFGVCARVLMLVHFAINAASALALPDIFSKGVQQGSDQFSRSVMNGNVVGAAFAGIVAIGALASGPLFSFVFGGDFAHASIPFAIMCAGLALRQVMGPAALMLSFHDLPFAIVPPACVGLAVLLIANLALVPSSGLIGTAIAVFVAIAAWSFALWLSARFYLQQDVSIVSHLQEMRSATARR
jgi:O-antigen/teichoic acid export membrane protein